MKRTLIFFSLFGGCIILAVTALILVDRIPSDAELVSTFEDHKEAFSKLRHMVASEPKEFIGMASDKVMFKETWNQIPFKEANVDPRRFSDYQKIMKENDIHQFWRDENEFLVLCGFSGWGFASKGPRFAYIHRTVPPHPLLKSLDDFKKSEKGWTTAYRPLSKDWYMRLIW